MHENKACRYCFPHGQEKMAASVTGSTLSEHDIPGATLQGCNPAVLKADELCFWLNTQTSDEIQLKAKLQKINPNFALAQIMSPGGASCKETKLENLPVVPMQVTNYSLQNHISKCTVTLTQHQG